MNTSEDSQASSLSASELKHHDKLQERAMRQTRARMRKRVKTALILLGFASISSLIIWQGVRTSRQQAVMAAASSMGGPAPDFTLPATTEGTIKLSDFQGKKNVLLYFSEGLSCEPCIKQTTELEKALSEFEKMNVTLLSVALDPVDKLKKEAEDRGLKTPLLSYHTAPTEKDYNLLPFSMGMERRAGHTFVLVDTNGTIKWRKDYWPGRGHMVAGGVMFVEAPEIVQNVKTALGL